MIVARRVGRDLWRRRGRALTFEGVDEALKIPGSELRLFGKPQSFVKRRMGVALARGTTTDEARDARQTRRGQRSEASRRCLKSDFPD